MDRSEEVKILNRTVTVRPDGTWRLTNIPAQPGIPTPRVVCRQTPVHSFQTPLSERTVTLGAGDVVSGMVIEDFDGDTTVDLALALEAPPGQVSGQIRVYDDILNNQLPSLSFGVPGPSPNIETVIPRLGALPLLVAGDGDYDGVPGAQSGVMVVLDPGTGAVLWGIGGSAPGVRTGASIATRNPTATLNGLIAVAAPEPTGAGGFGLLFDAFTRNQILGVQGIPGANVGLTATEFSGDSVVFSNHRATDPSNPSENGHVADLNLATQTARQGFGAPFENRGKFLRALSDNTYIEATPTVIRVVQPGTGAVLGTLPIPHPGHEIEVIDAEPGINTPTDFVTYHTEAPLGGGNVERNVGMITRQANLAIDQWRVQIGASNTVNFAVDEPTQPNALAVFGLAPGKDWNNQQLPNIAGILPLQVPFQTLAFQITDVLGFTLYTLQANLPPSMTPGDFTVTAALIGQSGAVTITNPVVIEAY